MTKPEYHYVPVPQGSDMTSDPIHQALQGHILSCDQCRKAIEAPPVKLGERSKMCQEYLQIAAWFSEGHEIGTG